MLSEHDKQAYLMMLRKRRRVRRYIHNANQTRKTIADSLANQDDNLNELIGQIDFLRSDSLVSFSDYKDLLLLRDDIYDKMADLVERDDSLEDFAARMESRVAHMSKRIETARQSLRAFHKGRGKVLYLEGKRS